MTSSNPQDRGSTDRQERSFRFVGTHGSLSLRGLWRASVLAVIAAGMTLALAGPVAAHATSQPCLYVIINESSVEGRVELAIDDIVTVLGLDLDGDDATIEAKLREQGDVLRRYVGDHLTIASDGGEWDIEFGGVELLRIDPNVMVFAVVHYRATVPAGGMPQYLDITFDPFFNELDDRDALLLLVGGWENGAYRPDREVLVSYTEYDPVRTVDLGQPTQWGNFRSGVSLGIDHIRTGPDHILFVLALLLPSVLVFRETWGPTRGFASALWRVVKIATFFTIAHSVTFTLAGMGWLPLPPSIIVESVIAASIAAAALHNLRPIFPNREWALAFVFGLFHGMGFASLVAALDVSRTSQLVSLLGRNVGIEIGQVVVILLLFPSLYMLRRTPVYVSALRVSSVVLSVVALGWMVERVLEVDLGINDAVDLFAKTPNGYWVAGTLVLVAAGIYAAAERRDALTPLPTTSR